MKNQRGFTLIELLLYMGISAIVLLALSGFFGALLKARIRNETITLVNQQGDEVMTLLTEHIRNSQSIDLPVAGESGDSLSLTENDPALSPTVLSVVDGSLLLSEGGGDPVPLTNSAVTVSDLVVANEATSGSVGSVRVSFDLARKSSANLHEYSYLQHFDGAASLRQR